MCDMAHPAGLIAKGLLTNPLPYCDVVTSTTHKTLRGPRGGVILVGKDKENPLGIKTFKGDRLKMMSEVIRQHGYARNTRRTFDAHYYGKSSSFR